MADLSQEERVELRKLRDFLWFVRRHSLPPRVEDLTDEEYRGVITCHPLVTVALSSEPIQAGWPSGTDKLVDRFAEALKAKLRAAEAKYGYNDGWLDDHWQDDLRTKLVEHLHKGDPRDVAAYCAFAWHHAWSVTPPSGGGAPDGWRLVPVEMAPEQRGSLELAFLKVKGWASHLAAPKLYATALDAAPPPPPTGRVDADAPHQAREEG